jgi:porphobilinogen deaminase
MLDWGRRLIVLRRQSSISAVVTEIFTTGYSLPAPGRGACVIQIRQGSKSF